MCVGVLCVFVCVGVMHEYSVFTGSTQILPCKKSNKALCTHIHTHTHATHRFGWPVWVRLDFKDNFSLGIVNLNLKEENRMCLPETYFPQASKVLSSWIQHLADFFLFGAKWGLLAPGGYRKCSDFVLWVQNRAFLFLRKMYDWGHIECTS